VDSFEKRTNKRQGPLIPGNHGNIWEYMEIKGIHGNQENHGNDGKVHVCDIYAWMSASVRVQAKIIEWRTITVRMQAIYGTSSSSPTFSHGPLWLYLYVPMFSHGFRKTHVIITVTRQFSLYGSIRVERREQKLSISVRGGSCEIIA
jgi:hypothetical protein